MASGLRIGIDFDNTIIAYDQVFCTAAKLGGLISADFVGGKQAVRDFIRLLPDGELTWQRLQGQVYGKGISGAMLIPGVDAFLRRCRDEGCTVSIVSHKTEYGHYDPERINLREAARKWMTTNGLLDGEFGISSSNIFFEGTRAAKLARIASLSCTHFIDDLEEVLLDPAFPSRVERILFSEHEGVKLPVPYMVCPTWRDIEDRIFARRR
jgi:hypothetical protein